jgi:hypothetical protein
MCIVVDSRSAGIPANLLALTRDEWGLGAGEGVVDGQWRKFVLLGGADWSRPFRLLDGGGRHGATREVDVDSESEGSAKASGVHQCLQSNNEKCNLFLSFVLSVTQLKDAKGSDADLRRSRIPERRAVVRNAGGSDGGAMFFTSFSFTCKTIVHRYIHRSAPSRVGRESYQHPYHQMLPHKRRRTPMKSQKHPF